jgi:hypothetical protein
MFVISYSLYFINILFNNILATTEATNEKLVLLLISQGCPRKTL